MSQTANEVLDEGKEENVNKEEKKDWPHQTGRSMGPSNLKQDLKLRITEFRDKIHQLCPT